MIFFSQSMLMASQDSRPAIRKKRNKSRMEVVEEFSPSEGEPGGRLETGSSCPAYAGVNHKFHE
jgi:hypothetical protein